MAGRIPGGNGVNVVVTAETKQAIKALNELKSALEELNKSVPNDFAREFLAKEDLKNVSDALKEIDKELREVASEEIINFEANRERKELNDLNEGLAEMNDEMLNISADKGIEELKDWMREKVKGLQIVTLYLFL